MKLTEAENGQEYRIMCFSPGKSLEKKLGDMGISAGSLIRKLSGRKNGGPVMIRHKNTRIALGRGMASKIEVDMP
jgi:Fe2+ transport system protein FeoA